jgi:hypothetical protein
MRFAARMRTGDLCQLAADLALEHGAEATAIARQASMALEREGESERAHFWQSLSVLLDDIFAFRLDPDLPIVIH